MSWSSEEGFQFWRKGRSHKGQGLVYKEGTVLFFAKYLLQWQTYELGHYRYHVVRYVWGLWLNTAWLQIRGDIHIIFFLFLHENICCGYSLEAPRWGASNSTTIYVFEALLMSTHNICFRGEIRQISAFFQWKKHPICCYDAVSDNMFVNFFNTSSL